MSTISLDCQEKNNKDTLEQLQILYECQVY